MKKQSTRSSKVTSKDVAQLAGVSQSTVSRVLGQKGPSTFISDETAQRVREAAEKLVYSPNPIARALRGERTYILGLVVREISDPFFAEFIHTLSEQARKQSYHILLSHVHSDPTEGLEMVRVLDSRQCDGVIFLGDLRNDVDVMRSILSDKVPAVALCRGRKFTSIPTINCDNHLGINLIMDYLTSLGHLRIGFIDGGWLGDIRDRRDAFV